METIEQKQKRYEELRLVLAINKHLRRWKTDYADQLRDHFKWASDEFFAGVVDQMEHDGLLTKSTSPRGALVLTYKEGR